MAFYHILRHFLGRCKLFNNKWSGTTWASGFDEDSTHNDIWRGSQAVKWVQLPASTAQWVLKQVQPPLYLSTASGELGLDMWFKHQPWQQSRSGGWWLVAAIWLICFAPKAEWTAANLALHPVGSSKWFCLPFCWWSISFVFCSYPLLGWSCFIHIISTLSARLVCLSAMCWTEHLETKVCWYLLIIFPILVEQNPNLSDAVCSYILFIRSKISGAKSPCVDLLLSWKKHIVTGRLTSSMIYTAFWSSSYAGFTYEKGLYISVTLWSINQHSYGKSSWMGKSTINGHVQKLFRHNQMV